MALRSVVRAWGLNGEMKPLSRAPSDKHQGQSGGSRNGLGACTNRTRSPGPGVDIAGCGGRRKWKEGVGAADPTKGSLVRSLDFLPKQGSSLGSVKQGWDLPISS